MIGFHPLSAFAVGALDPADSQAVKAGIAALADDVAVALLWAVEIHPFQPGAEVVVVDDDVEVEISWIQFQVPQ